MTRKRRSRKVKITRRSRLSAAVKAPIRRADPFALLDKHGVPVDEKSRPVDEKSKPAAGKSPPPVRLSSILRLAVGRGARGLQQANYDLASRYTITSGAGSALNTVAGIVPSLSSEFSSLAQLYDEMKVNSVTVQFSVQSSGTVVNTQTYGVLVYDPVDAGVYSSVAAASVAYRRVVFAVRAPTTVALVTPDSTTNFGSHVLQARVPGGESARSVTSGSLLFSGEWSDTLDTAVYGYLKPYVEALGGTAVTQLSGIIMYHCSFRCRT